MAGSAQSIGWVLTIDDSDFMSKLSGIVTRVAALKEGFSDVAKDELKPLSNVMVGIKETLEEIKIGIENLLDVNTWREIGKTLRESQPSLEAARDTAQAVSSSAFSSGIRGSRDWLATLRDLAIAVPGIFGAIRFVFRVIFSPITIVRRILGLAAWLVTGAIRLVTGAIQIALRIAVAAARVLFGIISGLVRVALSPVFFVINFIQNILGKVVGSVFGVFRDAFKALMFIFEPFIMAFRITIVPFFVVLLPFIIAAVADLFEKMVDWFEWFWVGKDGQFGLRNVLEWITGTGKYRSWAEWWKEFSDNWKGFFTSWEGFTSKITELWEEFKASKLGKTLSGYWDVAKPWIDGVIEYIRENVWKNALEPWIEKAHKRVSVYVEDALIIFSRRLAEAVGIDWRKWGDDTFGLGWMTSAERKEAASQHGTRAPRITLPGDENFGVFKPRSGDIVIDDNFREKALTSHVLRLDSRRFSKDESARIDREGIRNELRKFGPEDQDIIRRLMREGKVPWHEFALGGIVRQPVMGLVGEAGTEAVIPLNDSNMPDVVRNIMSVLDDIKGFLKQIAENSADNSWVNDPDFTGQSSRSSWER
jgi:hypothetical protein